MLDEYDRKFEQDTSASAARGRGYIAYAVNGYGLSLLSRFNPTKLAFGKLLTRWYAIDRITAHNLQ